ncbi:Takeout-like protein 3 [Operophtera brumata]|uniref:Takeout-like protein 3 n=1 Tax=Operophtera brumata TaxID=104452 RepID=A0A0L7KU25_OPEBR|nr:Takeout-like protein 3 [Operophtera brumata]
MHCNFTIRGVYSLLGRLLLFNLDTEGSAKVKICANILQVLNSDAQAFASEFGGPILDYAIDYAMNVTQRFFDAYTYDQLTHVPLTEEFFEKE